MDKLSQVKPRNGLMAIATYAGLIDVIFHHVNNQFKSIDAEVLMRDSNNVILFIVELIESACGDETFVPRKMVKTLNRSDLCMDVLKRVFPAATAEQLAQFQNQLQFIIDTKLVPQKKSLWGLGSSFAKGVANYFSK